MRRDLINSALAIVVFTVMLGLAYPLITTGVSQVVFPNKADGSQVERDGKVVGSRLIGQDFRKPVLAQNGKPKLDADGNPVLEPDKRYFQSRPSVTGYSGDVTYFNNLGPNQKDLADMFKENLDAYLALERPYNPGLRRADVPPDAVQTTASGVDPHISQANASIQARRIAEVRGLPLNRVMQLIDDNTDKRALGFLGEPGVNVLELNLALDREVPRQQTDNGLEARR
jgi:K+-transporting ATPase ATPase C chain